MRILVADALDQEQLDRLTAAGFAVLVEPHLKDEELREALDRLDPDVLVVRSTKVQATHLQAARSLSLVVRAGAGVNTIDVAEASRRGVWIANCPGKNAVAVAELAFAHILALDRFVVDGANDLRAGRWNKKQYGAGRGIAGQTLGLLGVGGIGSEMIGRARAFGMRVVAWSRSLTDERAEELGVERAESPLEVAKQADVLSVHLALNDETRHLVSAEIIAALPDGATVINTSRGGLIDEAALAAAVRDRGLRAGLDVFEGEPSGGAGELDPGLFALEGVQGSHHIGASTHQAQVAVAAEVVRIATVYRDSGRVENCVNLAADEGRRHLLVVRHADRVGVLAGVLAALRAADINVQEMENQLFAGGEAASARIYLSSVPDEDTLESIRGQEHILAVSVAP